MHATGQDKAQHHGQCWIDGIKQEVLDHIGVPDASPQKQQQHDGQQGRPARCRTQGIQTNDQGPGQQQHGLGRTGLAWALKILPRQHLLQCHRVGAHTGHQLPPRVITQIHQARHRGADQHNLSLELFCANPTIEDLRRRDESIGSIRAVVQPDFALVVSRHHGFLDLELVADLHILHASFTTVHNEILFASRHTQGFRTQARNQNITQAQQQGHATHHTVAIRNEVDRAKATRAGRQHRQGPDRTIKFVQRRLRVIRAVVDRTVQHFGRTTCQRAVRHRRTTVREQRSQHHA